MYQITRMWLGFAGIGVGLVHMALAAGSPLLEGILFTILARPSSAGAWSPSPATGSSCRASPAPQLSRRS